MKPDKVLCSRFLFAFFGLDLGLDRAQNTIGVYSGLRNQPILQGHGPFRFINYGFDMLVLILMSWPSALAHKLLYAYACFATEDRVLSCHLLPAVRT